MIQNCTQISDENFLSEAHNNDQPVMVAFTATWCGLCHITEAIIDRIASQFVDQMKFCKVDSELNPVVKEWYGIHELPTLLVFYKGEIVDHRCGAISQDELLVMLHNVLNRDRSIEKNNAEMVNIASNPAVTK